MDGGTREFENPDAGIDQTRFQRKVGHEVESALIERRHEFQGYLTRRLGNRAAAEDVLQQFCIRVYSSNAPLKDSKRMVPWLYAVLRSTMIDHCRRETVRDRNERDFGVIQAIEDDAQKPDDQEGIGICGCMSGIISRMSHDFADVLSRVDLAGQRPTDVAAELGLTPNSVRVRLHRARQSLKVELFRNCGPCAENGCRNCTCKQDSPKRCLN